MVLLSYFREVSQDKLIFTSGVETRKWKWIKSPLAASPSTYKMTKRVANQQKNGAFAMFYWGLANKNWDVSI